MKPKYSRRIAWILPLVFISTIVSARLPVTQQAYIKASNTDTGDWFGHFEAISGDTLVVGTQYEGSDAAGVDGEESDNSLTDAGAAYVFVRSGTTWTQQAYLKSANPQDFGLFGIVAVSSNTIAVGASGEKAAYIFVRDGTNWTQQAQVTGGNGNFGNAVAIDGDTLVIGSNEEQDSEGAAYVFFRDGTNWIQQAHLKASNPEANDNFGAAVAISGDKIVVGAYWEDSNATGVNGDQSNNLAANSGAAYVFVRNGTNWTQEAYLKASDTAAGSGAVGFGQMFGVSVTISTNTAVIGSFSESTYVFVRNGTNWSQQARLQASNFAFSKLFGAPVALSGDILAVGASSERSAAQGINGNQNLCCAVDSGAAYVFTRTGTNWTQAAYLKASNAERGDALNNPDQGDHFGGVCLSDNTLAIGARSEDSDATGVNGDQFNNNATDSGAVYVFTLGTPYFANSTVLSNGAFQFQFADTGSTNFTVLASTNLYLPGSNWTTLGAPLSIAPGHYQFTDLQATNSTQRFYRVRSP